MLVCFADSSNRRYLASAQDRLIQHRAYQYVSFVYVAGYTLLKSNTVYILKKNHTLQKQAEMYNQQHKSRIQILKSI